MSRDKKIEKDNTKVLLSRSRTSRAFEPSESLWDDEIGRIQGLLKDHLEEIRFLNQQKDHIKPDDFKNKQSILSVALYGTYGSGKSSLLRTLSRQVNDNDLDTKHYDTFKKIRALDVIEPSLLSENTNFLYAFLAAALEADAKKQHGHLEDTSKESRIITPVEQRFHNVSEYLQAIDEDHYHKGATEDHLNLSFHRLERHTSAFLLKEKLYNFIDTLADSLTGVTGNSILLMPVDDADMLPHILVDTLRNIQLYLRHPRLVPIFTFTGRMAEELLRTDYEKKLGVDQRSHALQKITEASTSLTIAENLAVQFLGKIFPVRNRIKLSNASKRVIEAEFYKSSSKEKQDSKNEEEKIEGANKVRTLLETATTLLFGHVKWPIMPKITASLESATLRRQMQIIDAMDATEIRLLFTIIDRKYDFYAEFMFKSENDQNQKENVPYYKTWAVIFDRATWALLNVHRDVLKEFQLNLDDLYSWTKEGLRRTVLAGVLSRNLEGRRDLLNQWRYQGTDRRSQMISLLALNAYRPIMVGEFEENKNQPVPFNHAYSMAVRNGILWFVNVWCSFYLPQILGRNRPNNAKGQLPDYEPVSSIGWDLINAPYRAVREALNNNLSKSSGILFLEPSSMAEKVNDLIEYSNNLTPRIPNSNLVIRSIETDDANKPIINVNKSTFNEFIKTFNSVSSSNLNYPGSKLFDLKSDGIEFLNIFSYTDIELPKASLNDIRQKEVWRQVILDIWCFYGEDRGKTWSCISLWRPLCLMAQIINKDIEFRHSEDWIINSSDKNGEDPEGLNDKRRKAIVRSIIIDHLKSSEIFGNTYMSSQQSVKNYVNLRNVDKIFDNLPKTEKRWASNWRLTNFERVIESLAEAILYWLKNFDRDNWRIKLVFANIDKNLKNQHGVATGPTNKLKNDLQNPIELLDWQMCFVRRLHGSSLLHDFWQQLETYKDIEVTNPPSAIMTSKIWLKVLSRYWNCGRKAIQLPMETNQQKVLHPSKTTESLTRKMILDCPLIKPFAPADRLAIFEISSYLNNISDSSIDLEKRRTDIKKLNKKLNRWIDLIKKAIDIGPYENHIIGLHILISYCYYLSIKIVDLYETENEVVPLVKSILILQYGRQETNLSLQKAYENLPRPPRKPNSMTLDNIFDDDVKNFRSIFSEDATKHDNKLQEIRGNVDSLKNALSNSEKTESTMDNTREINRLEKEIYGSRLELENIIDEIIIKFTSDSKKASLEDLSNSLMPISTFKEGSDQRLIPDLYELWANAAYRFEYFSSVKAVKEPFINSDNYFSARAEQST